MLHPLALFPQILFLGPGMAPLLLRLAVGGFLLFKAWGYCKNQKILCVTFTIPGILLVLGLYTQPGAIIALAVLGYMYYTGAESKTLTLDTIFIYSLCAVILISLLFTGPGFFAFDLPL